MKTEVFELGGIPALRYGEGGREAFLYVHGRHGSKADALALAEVATSKGYDVIAFDLPEHGDRAGETRNGIPYACDARNGSADLRSVHGAIAKRYESLSLFACSLGAYFSLVACAGGPGFAKALFLSPILDMERLIANMMGWAGVSEERLRREGTVATDFGETLSWDYLSFARDRRLKSWTVPTAILYGEGDSLTERGVLDGFAARFGCSVDVMAGGEHYFHTPEQLAHARIWMEREIAAVR